MTNLDKISNNWPNDSFGVNVYKTLKFCWYSSLSILQWTNNTSVISKYGKLSRFLSLVVLLLFTIVILLLFIISLFQVLKIQDNIQS